MSDSKIDQYRQIHATQKYGDTSIKNLRYLRPQVRMLNPKSILDFGCGQSKLLDVLCKVVGATGTRYDPAIPEFSEIPSRTHDLLTNIDVLEHVPEDHLDELIGQMASLCGNAIIVIDTTEAEKTLPNGENAHCTVRPHEWWHKTLSKHFEYVEPIRVARKSRAAFRTWKLDHSDAGKLKRMIFGERIRHGLRRLVGVKGHS